MTRNEPAVSQFWRGDHPEFQQEKGGYYLQDLSAYFLYDKVKSGDRKLMSVNQANIYATIFIK